MNAWIEPQVTYRQIQYSPVIFSDILVLSELSHDGWDGCSAVDKP